MRYDSSVRLSLGRQGVSLPVAHAPCKSAAFLEVLRVLGIVGVGGPDDFNMASDCGAGGFIEDEHLACSSFLGKPDAEVPVPGRRREVFLSPPSSGLFGVASFGPAQQLPKDMMVQPIEGPLGGPVPIVVGPTSQERVELAEERFLWFSQGGFDAEADFLAQGFHATLCGIGQQFVPKFAHGVPQKVEPLVEVGDDGLLL